MTICGSMEIVTDFIFALRPNALTSESSSDGPGSQRSPCAIELPTFLWEEIQPLSLLRRIGKVLIFTLRFSVHCAPLSCHLSRHLVRIGGSEARPPPPGALSDLAHLFPYHPATGAMGPEVKLSHSGLRKGLEDLKIFIYLLNDYIYKVTTKDSVSHFFLKTHPFLVLGLAFY